MSKIRFLLEGWKIVELIIVFIIFFFLYNKGIGVFDLGLVNFYILLLWFYKLLGFNFV